MKSPLPLLCLLSLAVSVSAQSYDDPQPRGFIHIIGPRVGAYYTFQSRDTYAEKLSKIYPKRNYHPLSTAFGISFEQRLLLGETRNHFAFQEVLMVGGLEQNIAMPSFSALIGFRAASGFELGAGPMLSLSGIGVITAIGWTFSYKGVYVPVNLSAVLPSHQNPLQLALTTGFNFKIR